ncbi:hypothetical protein J4405_06380 [Candidatus Woesearchaeota archaeon]|nr:hypothetical protein [Candidatus Woesearchaeota archaeon]
MKKVLVLLGDPRLSDPVKNQGKFNAEDLEVIDVLKKALSLLSNYEFEYFDEHAKLKEKLANFNYDYVLNFCDEGLFNNAELESEIPKMLDELKIKYTGASVKCLTECFNKIRVKEKARGIGIPTSKDVLVPNGHPVNVNFCFPAFVKPNYGDGSFGIDRNSLVKNESELKLQVQNIKLKLSEAGRKDDVLVEEFLEGYEISAAVIGNEIRLIQEKFPKNINFNLHETKWNPESKYWNETVSIKPEISFNVQNKIKEYSLKLFKEMGCRDYARFDFRLDSNNEPRLLEVNPNCGWCWDGHLTKAFLIDKYEPETFVKYNEKILVDYVIVLEKILKTAERRF